MNDKKNKNEIWSWNKHNDSYVFICSIGGKKQIIFVNKTFKKATAYLLRKTQCSVIEREYQDFYKENNGFVWIIYEIIYDFLQVLLIQYLAHYKTGIFIHAFGMHDRKSGGIIFSGRSGRGKSTMARLWHQNSKSTILNDDRVIIRKKKNNVYRIYSSPWFGEFTHFRIERLKPKALKAIFFIHHAVKNRIKRISSKESFKRLWPNIFLPFWDKEHIQNCMLFSLGLLEKTPCFDLWFRKDKSIVKFIKKNFKN